MMDRIAAPTIMDYPDPELRECDACGFGGVLCRPLSWRRYENQQRAKDPDDEWPEFKWLCALCSNTMSGIAMEYQTEYPVYELKTICYVGNAIIGAIAEMGVITCEQYGAADDRSRNLE